MRDSTFQIGYEKSVPLLPWPNLSDDKADAENSGGPAGLIYGFFVTWLGSLASFASLAELASMYDVDTIRNCVLC